MAYDFSEDFTELVEELGTTITLVSKGTLTISEYGDERYINSAKTDIIAVVNDLSGDETFNRDGIFSPGDKIFFISEDSTLTEKNKNNYTITYDNQSYKIMAVIQPPISENIQLKEVRCKKI